MKRFASGWAWMALAFGLWACASTRDGDSIATIVASRSRACATSPSRAGCAGNCPSRSRTVRENSSISSYSIALTTAPSRTASG